MVTVFITFVVENFIEWKKIFDINKELRKEVGIKTIGIYVLASDADHIECVVEAPSIEAFEKHFFSNPKVSEALKKQAIVKEPVIKYYNKISDI